MEDNYSILLADDEPDIRRALKRSLHVPGYSMHEAGDGVDALALLKRTPCDAIISDFNMPRMNGLDLLTQVRIMYPNMLRILLTARADVHLAVRALNEGAVHRFLLKPWDHVDLKGIVRMALHSMQVKHTEPPGER
ncbi:MAG: response regulator [Myxococcales bacterium]|nr:response regulator [Myxococcales bacterium]